MNKSHEERDRLAKERFPWPHFCVVHPDVLARRNDFKAGFDAATEIHQHILAEKEKRIEKLREALKFYSGGEMSDIDMDIFDKIRLNTKDPKHVYVEWVDTEWLCNPARAALQEETK